MYCLYISIPPFGLIFTLTMFWRRYNTDKTFKATSKYLPTIEYCLEPFHSCFSREHLAYVRFWAHVNHRFIRKKNCVTPVVTYYATNIQDGEQLNAFN